MGNTASALTAQSAFLANFENVANHRVNIQEDIKRYQDTISYTSGKVDYSMGENIYILSSVMNLKIKTGTVGYNNKILISDEKFSLGKNDKVNSLELTPEISYKAIAQPTTAHRLSLKPTITQAQKQTITHEDEKVALVLPLASGFAIWYAFR